MTKSKIRPIEEHLIEYLGKILKVHDEEWSAAECVARNLKVWENAYGAGVAGRVRDRIRADWRRRFPARQSGRVRQDIA